MSMWLIISFLFTTACCIVLGYLITDRFRRAQAYQNQMDRYQRVSYTLGKSHAYVATSLLVLTLLVNYFVPVTALIMLMPTGMSCYCAITRFNGAVQSMKENKSSTNKKCYVCEDCEHSRCRSPRCNKCEGSD